jgi:hypothetical protein
VIALPVGQYISGLQATATGVIASINYNNPLGAHRHPSLVMFDQEGHQTSGVDIDADCAIGGPKASPDQRLGVASCLRTKREPFDYYRILTNKLITYQVDNHLLSVVSLRDAPNAHVAASVAVRDDTGNVMLAIADESGTVFLLK